MRRQQSRTAAGASKAVVKKKRATYDQAFKLKVVREALQRPPHNRIKPTCARFPGIEPCQVMPPPLPPRLPARTAPQHTRGRPKCQGER